MEDLDLFSVIIKIIGHYHIINAGDVSLLMSSPVEGFWCNFKVLTFGSSRLNF